MRKSRVGSPPWRRVSLGEICDTFSGGTPSRDRKDLFGGPIPWIKSGELKAGEIWETEESLTQAGLENSAAKIVQPGVNLLALYGATAGTVGRSRIRAAINQAILAVVPKSPDLDANFLQFVLQKGGVELLSRAQGAQPNLNAAMVRQFRLELPPLKEQQRIAEILDCFDRTITGLNALLITKTERFRGLRQQLLTGDRQFSYFKKQRWVSQKIGELLIPVNRYEEWNNERTYKLAGVRRNAGGVFFREELLGSQIKVKTCKKIHTGDFLISRRQIAWGGMSLVPIEFHGFDVNDEYEVLQVKEPNKFDMRFFHYLSQTTMFKNLACLASNGVFAERLRLNFDLNAFLKQPVRIPSTKEEQLKIIALLDGCTKEISLLGDELEAVRRQKHALREKLLTGKIRVKTK